jgi:alkylhydroperoxidase family enzyme
MLDPVATLGHNVGARWSDGILALRVDRWHQLDQGLKDLAVMAAAGRIGCSRCLGFGYWEATMNHTVPAKKVRAVPGWWDSEVFTELERLVLGYAEAMTATPPAVTDELVAQLREHLTDAQLVELTAVVAVQNLRSRINAALGLTAQGVKDRREVKATVR